MRIHNIPSHRMRISPDDEFIGDDNLPDQIVIMHVNVFESEFYCLMVLLRVIGCLGDYRDLRMICGVVYLTLKDVKDASGLLEGDRECIDAIVEASAWSSHSALRKLFATMISLDSVVD